MTSFASKFINRLNKIDSQHVESFLTQLVKEKNIQRAIFDSLHEGIILADHNHKVRFINEPMHGLLGLGKRKVLGETVRQIFRIEALQRWADEFTEHGQPLDDLEIALRTPAPRVYSLSVVPLKDDESGDLTHSIWIIQDRTDTHRRAAEKQQLENMRSLAVLTAGIAHEIKNPLNSLGIHAQLIQKTCSDLSASKKITEESINRMYKSTAVFREELDRLGVIVDQFIHAVRPVKLSLQPTKMNLILNTICELLEPELKMRSILLIKDFDPVLPSLNADTFQLQQALLNIVKNAMEAIPEDEVEGRIILRTKTKSDYLLIEVEDNGVGISEDDRLKIFEPYNTTKTTGTGLGLMVVYRIINAHRGAIGLDSQVGFGTTFRIALPLDEKPIRLLAAEAGGKPIVIDEPTLPTEELLT